MRFFLSLSGAFAIAISSGLLAAGEHAAVLDRFLGKYCLECHDDLTEEGDRSFEATRLDWASDGDVHDLEEILDQLHLGEMPPAEAAQPSAVEIDAVVGILTKGFIAREERFIEENPPPRLRRLNQREYRNTIRDLLALETEAYDPTSGFAKDEEVDGLDTNSAALRLSDALLQQYLDSALDAVGKALRFGPQPEPFSRLITPDQFHASEYQHPMYIHWVVNHDDEFIQLASSAEDRDRLFARNADGAAPHDGHYEVEIRAEAVGREHPYDDSKLGTDQTEALILDLFSSDPKAGYLGRANSSDRLLTSFQIEDDQIETYRARVWLEAGHHLIIRYRNGPRRIRQVVHDQFPIHHPEIDNRDWDKGIEAQNWPRKIERPYISDVYEGPRIRIYDIAFAGPFYETWPPASHRATIGPSTETPFNRVREAVIHRFVERAFRGRATDEVKASFVAYADQLQSEGVNGRDTIQQTLAAILCSPRFLYRHETGAPLDSLSRANRLSYTLWSSMPDPWAMNLAATEALLLVPNARAEAERLLADPKSEDFIRHFSDDWLALDKLGSMPPDPVKFDAYYRDSLGSAQREETYQFISDLIRRNAPAAELVRTDYTFVNRPLAKLYQIEPLPEGLGFERVSLDQKSFYESKRGGLPGQSSIQTLSSNGVETSPVVRGIWILEHLLGTPPQPPPPDVATIDPDIRGAETVREILAKHAETRSCAQCHKKIDPYGFAMEIFDPIGRLRSYYRYVDEDHPRNLQIDASGVLPDGTEFRGFGELTHQLRKRDDRVAAHFAKTLLAYGTGRTLTARDRSEMEEIISARAREGYPLRKILLDVVTSKAFLER